MAEKARLFGDVAARRSIVASSDPARQRRLGKTVSNFNQELWEQHRHGIVLRDNPAKSSVPSRLQQLVDTVNEILAKASPYDLIWGIGLRAGDPQALRPSIWPGLDRLGDVLMKVRRLLDSSAPVPPSLSARFSPSDNGIHEISTPARPAPTPSTFDQALPPFLPDTPPPLHLR